uniref:Putative secreted protein n=1 Tax=Rhipicephalus microplus TaxID=6941 RepID=A0A6G5A1X4_RHIMP
MFIVILCSGHATYALNSCIVRHFEHTCQGRHHKVQSCVIRQELITIDVVFVSLCSVAGNTSPAIFSNDHNKNTKE